MSIYIPAVGAENLLDIFEVQCVFFEKGDYNIVVTGMVAQNIIETISVAFSVIKQMNIAGDIMNIVGLEERDYHIHFTNGAIIKEGTSAGLGIVFSILQALYHSRKDHKFLVTGEIDLFGQIHEVGGIDLKMKLMKMNRLDKFIFPRSNLSNKLDLSLNQFFPISTVKELVESFFCDPN